MLDLAARIARNERGNFRKEYLLACIIKRKDGAIVFSQNATVDRPRPQLHAEARALRKADAGCVLYVARIKRDGNWAIAKPCKFCQALIRNKRVKRVYYTIGPGEYGVWDVGTCKNI